MKYIAIAALLALAPMPVSAGVCAGADPVVSSAVVKAPQVSGGLSRYPITTTVVNNGASQAGNTRQFVDIYDDSGVKLDSKGVPPLRSGDAYTFTYFATRSAQAGPNSSKLTFKLDEKSGGGAADCDVAAEIYEVLF